MGKADRAEAPGLDATERACRGGRRHESLRRATAAAHRDLEAILQETGCFDSAAGYRRYLGAVAPLYGMLEATLDAAGAAWLLPDWPRRRKRALILAELGADAAAGQPLPDPRSAWCAGDVFGALYVIEGATLGGAVLARKMRAMGALAPRTACLLDPYGRQRGAMWRAFLVRLERVDLTRQEEEALCSRAVATFSLFATARESLMEGARLQ